MDVSICHGTSSNSGALFLSIQVGAVRVTVTTQSGSSTISFERMPQKHRRSSITGCEFTRTAMKSEKENFYFN